MAYEFKNLNEVPVQDAPTENTTVMAFESGQPKQIPASEFGGKGLVVDLRSYTINIEGGQTVISDVSYDPIYEAIMAGQNVVFHISIDSVAAFCQCIISAVKQGAGFIASLLAPGSKTIMLIFTNGSYHSTEAASE